ncbi:recombinase family protein [Leptothoe kymatousa]|uniref:Recombinase family protein n=1 Tax=Leptothoe kymatousa TAU-MAC 1615 TaxID=2364775 RepID=A0ABS5XZF4_9CYAN|nr:recombinase family protein [Leptothoe kymatousa]MBT9310984.1 recombinase family protein [Leptothoe kymatousa TAU-MAC 1615]
MHIAAYLYTDPQLETPTDDNLWGWEIDHIYHDWAIGPQRPQLDALLKKVPAPDYLLVRRLDELGDCLKSVTEHLGQIEAAGTVVIAIEQSYQTATGEQSKQLLPTVLADVATAHQRRRMRRGHAANRLKALPPPGKAPYGYRRGKQGYIIDRTTAPILKTFFEQFILYGSLRGAVRHIAKQYGKKISVSTGRRWLEHPIYRGHTRYGDGGIVLGTHRALLAEEEAAQIDRLLRRNRSLPPKTASAKRSLAGLVTCQACQTKLTVSKVSAPRRTQDYTYMRVTQCPHQCKALAYETLLKETIETICAELPKAVAQWDQPTESPKAGLETKIAAKQTILDQLPELITQGILDQTTADLRAYGLQTELATLKQQLAQLPPVNLKELSQAVSIPQFWEGLSETERRFFFREFIRDIQIVRNNNEWSLKLVFTF